MPSPPVTVTPATTNHVHAAATRMNMNHHHYRHKQHPLSSQWFFGAPITKCMAWVLLISYILLHSNLIRSWMIQIQNHEETEEEAAAVAAAAAAAGESGSRSDILLFRSVLRTLTFQSVSELILVGLLELVLSRKLEREMGSLQLVRLWWVMLSVYGCMRQMMAVVHHHYDKLMMMMMMMDKNNGATRLFVSSALPSSISIPYLYLGTLFWFYHKFTPRVYPRLVRIGGGGGGGGTLYFSERSIFYAWFLYGILFAASSSWGGGRRRRGNMNHDDGDHVNDYYYDYDNNYAASSSNTIVDHPWYFRIWTFVLLLLFENTQVPNVCLGLVSGMLFPMVQRFVWVPAKLVAALGPCLPSSFIPPPRIWVPMDVMTTMDSSSSLTPQQQYNHQHFRSSHHPHPPHPLQPLQLPPQQPQQSPNIQNDDHRRTSSATAAATTTLHHSGSGSGSGSASAASSAATAAMEQLVAMGFGRDEAMAALQATRNNDVHRAADILLGGG